MGQDPFVRLPRRQRSSATGLPHWSLSSMEGACDAVVALQSVSEPERYGVAELDEASGRLIQLVRSLKRLKAILRSWALYLLPPRYSMRSDRSNRRGETSLKSPTAIQKLIETATS